MGRFYRFIIILIAILSPLVGKSQRTDNEETIARATEEFNAGHFYSVPSILVNDSLNNFSREQKQRAFLLLTQTYLLLDDPFGTQKSFLEVLSANPEFIADEKLHPIDIVYLSKRFTATPKFSWFVGGGTNVSPMRLIYDLDAMEDKEEKYTFLPGYQIGAGGEYSYDDNIKFRIELNYLNTGYKSQALNYFEYDIKTFTDRQSWLNIPVYVSYADNMGKYRPYVYAGYSFSRLFGDKASITLQKVQGQGEESETFTVESPDFDFKMRRNELNQSMIFGGGVKYKIGLDFVFAELRYSAGLRNIVKPGNLYGNYAYDQISGDWVVSSSSTAEYAHVDDFLRLDNLSITFGFLRPLYKPRELRRARTKSVLRKMKRSE
jgi:hypothetical protein